MKPVASQKTLNIKNLEALGAERLAELLIEVSSGNASVKRRIRLELASAQSPFRGRQGSLQAVDHYRPVPILR
jgi:hypothetical protein